MYRATLCLLALSATTAFAQQHSLPPTILPIPDVVMQQDTSTEVLIFVEDDTRFRKLKVRAESDDPVLVPAEAIILETNRRGWWELEITPAAGESGQCMILVSASDRTSTDVNGFLLTVLPADEPPGEDPPPPDDPPVDPPPPDDPPPPTDLEVVHEKFAPTPADGEVIDISGKLFLGLEDTIFPDDVAPPSSWPTQAECEALEDDFESSNDERFPLSIQGSSVDFVIRGGAGYHRMHPLAPWHVWKSLGDSDAIRVEAGGYFEIDGFQADNVFDGVNPRGSNVYFDCHDLYITRVHDDMVENDEVHSGSLRDSYLTGHTFYSARGDINQSALFTVERCVVELILQPYEGHRDFDDQNHAGGYPYPDGLACGRLFKLDSDNLANSGQVLIRDTVFLVPRHSSSSMKAMRFALGTYENVTLVWLGDGAYPWPAPPGVTITRDRSAFDAAKAAWFAAHPEFAN